MRYFRRKPYFQPTFPFAMETTQLSANNRREQINWAIRILLSLLFLVSAVAKIYPDPSVYFTLRTFEVKQLLPMGFSETSAAYFSRILIGCELALGLLLLQRHYFKRLIIPVSALMLLVFCIHLTYEIITTGNKGNCGCFGALLPMTPLEALIKNIVAIGLLGYLYKKTDKNRDKLNFSTALSVVLGSILLIFMLGPIRPKQTVVPSAPVPTEETTLPEVPVKDSLPATTTTTASTAVADTATVVKVDEPKKKKSGFSSYYADIDKGKKVLCFFAPGCDHCKETAKELTQLRKGNPDFPKVQIIFMDEEAELIPAFFDYAGATYPHQIMEIGQFWQVLGGNRDTPGVFYIWNGNIVKTYDGINENAFKKNEFKALVKKPWSEIKK